MKPLGWQRLVSNPFVFTRSPFKDAFTCIFYFRAPFCSGQTPKPLQLLQFTTTANAYIYLFTVAAVTFPAVIFKLITARQALGENTGLRTLIIETNPILDQGTLLALCTTDTTHTTHTQYYVSVKI